MELNKVDQPCVRERDGCSVEGGSEKCDETSDVRHMFNEINQMYTERLLKLDELGDSAELRTKVLSLWVAELVEQNASLVDTVEELEREVAQRVLLLEDKLRKSSSSVQQYMAKAYAADGHTPASLWALVARLEGDIGSLLELIRRARTEGCWDMRGLVFCEVSYSDIFGSAPPPPSVPRVDESKLLKNDGELQKWKAEVELWRTRAEKAEAEIREVGEITFAADVSHELDQARRLAAEKTEQAQSLGDKLDLMQQHVKDVQEALTAEVAEKHDQVVQLRQRIQQLEEDCRQANKQTQFRDEIIKRMRKEVKMFRSQVTFHRKKVMNLADYFNNVNKNVIDLDRKFEKSEHCVFDGMERLFSFAMCELMELAESVNKVVETTDESRRTTDTSMLNTLTAAKSHSLEVVNLKLEVAALQQQLKTTRVRLQSAQDEVACKEETIMIMTDSAKVQDSIIRERERRIQAFEVEIAKNEERISCLTAALADQQKRNGDLREAVMSTQQQLLHLHKKDVSLEV